MKQSGTEGIGIEFLGDSGAFSRAGKSSGYRITVGSSQYLVDCGASIFQHISGHFISDLKAVLLTHAHDDHKRHFTDIALFKYYAPDVDGKITLLTTLPIHQAIRQSSIAALSMSLSFDSRRVVEIPYEDFVDTVTIGPRPKYRIREFEEEDDKECFRPRVVDGNGNVADPSLAKVVIHPGTKRGRILFRDPASGLWVDPEIYYPSNASCFYNEDQNSFVDPVGLEITAVTNISWHGIPSTGFRFRTEKESLLITGDTVHSRELWRSLSEEVQAQRLAMPREEFERAYVIYGDINDYIEQAWSPERYEEAVRAFEVSAIIHEIAGRKSIVHTDYHMLENTSLPRERVIMGHSPDIMVSEWVLGRQNRWYRVTGNEVFEEVNGSRYPFNADIYYKRYAECFVGYKNPEGDRWVYEKDGLLYISHGPDESKGEFRYRVDLYQDINGKYYPPLESEGQEYRVRSDGKVEVLDVGSEGSRGAVVKGMRAQLLHR